MREQVQKLALELQVRGLMNVQFAVKDNPGLSDWDQPACGAYRTVRLPGHRRTRWRKSGGARDGR
ncbi:hypothetical protein MJK72_04880 [Klebsiella pneumoniae]|nr:hypothetical protein MJK72_04880 [Klebsiella pneumoniae]